MVESGMGDVGAPADSVPAAHRPGGLSHQLPELRFRGEAG